MDGSSLSTSLAYQDIAPNTDQVVGTPESQILFSYYRYLSAGGGQNWLDWRRAYDEQYTAVVTTLGSETKQKWRAQLLTVIDRTALGKYGSLLLLIIVAALFFSNRLHERNWWAPYVYMVLVGLTTALYTAFAAPFAVALVTGLFIVYAMGLRFTLPLYAFEWRKSLRPFLNLIFFILISMAIRGPELLDYLFWTSPLYRLGLVIIVLLSIFFHLSILSKALSNAELDLTSRVLGYAMPLGFTAMVAGLVLGFYGGQSTEGALELLNRELLLFSPEVAAGFNPNGPFVLFFAGVALLICGGIGYFIQRIAK